MCCNSAGLSRTLTTMRPPTLGALLEYWIVQSAWDQKPDDELHLGWCRKAAGRLSEVSMQGNYVNEQADFGKDIALGAYGEKRVQAPRQTEGAVRSDELVPP